MKEEFPNDFFTKYGSVGGIPLYGLGMSTQPQRGEKAPDFDVPVIGGEYGENATVSLAELRGFTVVLYFYPKDATPGCTTQACGIRDAWGEISAHAKVFGVSIDPIKKHQQFLTKYDLPFPLISDEAKIMVEAYGVWVEKKLYGKVYFGTERTTFVIDKEGDIKAVFPKVKPTEHVDLLLEALKDPLN